VELRSALAKVEDLVVLYVMAENQVNEKTRRFIDELGLRGRVRFLVDPGSATMDALGIRLLSPEQIEAGVPHPATYVLDREGVIRFVDVRSDYHVWIASEIVAAAIHQLP